ACEDVHEPRGLLWRLGHLRVERKCGRRILKASRAQGVFEHAHRSIAQRGLVARELAVEVSLFQSLPYGDSEKLRAQKGVADPHPGQRVTVVGGIANQGP